MRNFIFSLVAALCAIQTSAHAATLVVVDFTANNLEIGSGSAPTGNAFADALLALPEISGTITFDLAAPDLGITVSSESSEFSTGIIQINEVAPFAVLDQVTSVGNDTPFDAFRIQNMLADDITADLAIVGADTVLSSPDLSDAVNALTLLLANLAPGQTPFISFSTSDESFEFGYDFTSFSVRPAEVPLPAAAWVFLVGLGALGAARKRKLQ